MLLIKKRKNRLETILASILKGKKTIIKNEYSIDFGTHKVVISYSNN